MSQSKLIRFLSNNPRTAYSPLALQKFYLKDIRNHHKKLRSLERCGMVNSTVVRMNDSAIRNFNIQLLNKKPKVNTVVNFWHIRPVFEIEKFIY